MNYVKKFCVEPGSKVKLGKIDAGFKERHESHEQALPEIEAYDQKLHGLQYLMYAEGERSLLICLQGRDASGKDGTINHVLGAMNPQGCTITSFKVPSNEVRRARRQSRSRVTSVTVAALQVPIYWAYASACHLQYVPADQTTNMLSLFALQVFQPLLWLCQDHLFATSIDSVGGI